ncbi:MAG: hypothetical protein WC378_12425 [Opitutaceae bacterium]
MNLQPIIDELAGQADELLAHVADRKEAKLTLSETLVTRYPKLNGVDRQKVVTSVMDILDEEEFFVSSGTRDSWSEGEDEEGA